MVVIWNELFYSRQRRRLVTYIDTHYNVPLYAALAAWAVQAAKDLALHHHAVACEAAIASSDRWPSRQHSLARRRQRSIRKATHPL